MVGEPMERKGMVKGKMAKGIADMHFMVMGPKGQAEISLTGTLKEGSKTEYDLGSITARKRSKDEENIVTIYEDGKPTVAIPSPPLGGSVYSGTRLFCRGRRNCC